MINILQILRNNARTFARLDINSDFTMEKYRSCKYARRNSGRGMYVSASSSELGGSGYVKYEVWYSLEIPLFMNKYARSEANFDAANVSRSALR